jgi:uncharacterized protein YgbK (DUF1537 family)
MANDRLLIIADDLSGAADSAIAFATPGRRTVVTLDAGSAVQAGGDAPGASRVDVMAIDTDTRRLSPESAAQQTADAFLQVAGAGLRFYKKIDSTLRGNWAAEVAALQPLAGLAIVAPAFPATGRTLREGRVMVHDVPLEDTPTWQLENAGQTADIRGMLEAVGLVCGNLGIEIVRSDSTVLQRAIDTAARDGVQALIVDAHTREDLHALAVATASTPSLFWVGSGGLSRELAMLPTLFDTAPESAPASAQGHNKHREHNAHHDDHDHGNEHEVIGNPSGHGATLVLVGSLSAVSERQCALLREQAGMREMTVPPSVLRGREAHADWAGWQACIGAALAGHVAPQDNRSHVPDTAPDALDAPSPFSDLLVRIGRDAEFDPAEGASLSTALAALVLPHFPVLGGLIVTGGETARAMLGAAGIGSLDLISEVEAGVAVARPSLPHPSYPLRPAIVTKAGAFGSEHALLGAYQHLQRLAAAGSVDPLRASLREPSSLECNASS